MDYVCQVSSVGFPIWGIIFIVGYYFFDKFKKEKNAEISGLELKASNFKTDADYWREKYEALAVAKTQRTRKASQGE